MPKKILITGATGFIGQSVFRLLKENKFKVTGISTEDLDLCDNTKLAKFFKKNHFDVIIHLAARVPKTEKDVEQRLSIIENVTSTLNILEEFKKSKTQKFIFASGISVTAQLKSLYVLSKYFGEILSQHYISDKKKITILRISAPYGPGQKPNNVIPIFINNALSNKEIKIFGSGKRSQDFIYIDDVAKAFLSAVRSEKSGIYNIGSGESTSTKKLAQIILKANPKSKSKIVFQGKDPEENYRLKMDVSKAKRDLKFSPKISIKEGIRRFIENSHHL